MTIESLMGSLRRRSMAPRLRPLDTEGSMRRVASSPALRSVGTLEGAQAPLDNGATEMPGQSAAVLWIRRRSARHFDSSVEARGKLLSAITDSFRRWAL